MAPARLGLSESGSAKLTLLACISICFFAFRPGIVTADTFKQGDDVQVHFLSKWYPGSVVSVDHRGRVGVRFEFTPGHAQQQWFAPTEVIYAFEAGALSRARFWADDSGKFRIKAALIAIDDESVTLRKPDQSEIKVALSRLSQNDRDYLKTIENQAVATQAPNLSAAESFDETSAKNISSESFDGPNHWPLVADPLPSDKKLKQGGVSFPTVLGERLAALIPVGGKEAWILAEVTSEIGDKSERLVWASLERQKVGAQQVLPAGESVVDYDAAGHRLLTVATVKGGDGGLETGVVTVWQVSPSDKQVKPIIRWKADPGGPGIRELWARFIDADNVLQRLKPQEYTLWNLRDKKLVYRLHQHSFVPSVVGLSPGRKYIALPEDDGVTVVEAATGEMLARLLPKERTLATAFSDDGRKLAIVGHNKLAIYDTAAPDAAQPEILPVQDFKGPVAWIGDRYLAAHTAEGFVLYSLRQHICVWSYSFDPQSAQFTRRSGPVSEIRDQYLIYSARLRQGAKEGLAVGAVRLPGPGVENADAAVDLDSMMVVKPGSQVRLDVQCGADSPRIQAALEAKIKANGWVLSPDSTNVLVAKMDRGTQQNKTYRMNDGSTQSASFMPYVSTLQMTVGGKLAWESASRNGFLPGMIWLKKGDTAQAEADRTTKPDPDFFQRVDIPAKILDPAKSHGFGTSEIGVKGLVVKNPSGEKPNPAH